MPSCQLPRANRIRVYRVCCFLFAKFDSRKAGAVVTLPRLRFYGLISAVFLAMPVLTNAKPGLMEPLPLFFALLCFFGHMLENIKHSALARGQRGVVESRDELLYFVVGQHGLNAAAFQFPDSGVVLREKPHHYTGIWRWRKFCRRFDQLLDAELVIQADEASFVGWCDGIGRVLLVLRSRFGLVRRRRDCLCIGRRRWGCIASTGCSHCGVGVCVAVWVCVVAIWCHLFFCFARVNYKCRELIPAQVGASGPAEGRTRCTN